MHNSENFKISMAAARVNAKMTQSEIAMKMHVSRQTVVNWETGRTIPSFAQKRLFCDLVGLPHNIIFFD